MRRAHNVGCTEAKPIRIMLVRLKRGTAGRKNEEVPCLVLNISSPWLFVM